MSETDESNNNENELGIAGTSFIAASDNPTQIRLVHAEDDEAWRLDFSDAQQAWLDRQSFKAKSGQVAWIEQLSTHEYGQADFNELLEEEKGVIAYAATAVAAYTRLRPMRARSCVFPSSFTPN